MAEILKVEGVGFSYGKKNVLEDISLSVNAGDVLAVLGHNGAGKTTLVKLIAGLKKARVGKITRNVEFHQIGYMNEELGLYPFLSGRENIEMLLERTGMKSASVNVSEVMKQFRLEDDKKAVSTYSTGMKKKLGLLCTMLGNPKLALLDEPFSGIDPVSLNFIVNYIKSKSSDNNAIVLVNHDLKTTSELCNRFIILNKGRIAYLSQTDDELKNLEQIYMKYSECE